MHNLTVLAFSNPTQALEVRDALIKLQDESLFEMNDAVAVTRDLAGAVTLHQWEGGVAAFTAGGSVTGMIVGAIFLNPLFGSVVGAGAGALIGVLVDLGINDPFIKDVGATLQPGTSALFLLGSKAQIVELGDRLGSSLRGCTILQTNVNKAREDEIRKMLESR